MIGSSIHWLRTSPLWLKFCAELGERARREEAHRGEKTRFPLRRLLWVVEGNCNCIIIQIRSWTWILLRGRDCRRGRRLSGTYAAPGKQSGSCVVGFRARLLESALPQVMGLGQQSFLLEATASSLDHQLAWRAGCTVVTNFSPQVWLLFWKPHSPSPTRPG